VRCSEEVSGRHSDDWWYSEVDNLRIPVSLVNKQKRRQGECCLLTFFDDECGRDVRLKEEIRRWVVACGKETVAAAIEGGIRTIVILRCPLLRFYTAFTFKVGHFRHNSFSSTNQLPVLETP
jgi:hypothetical protein